MEIWAEYQRIVEYMMNRDYFEEVKINEDFMEGKQWGNINVDTIPKPVINVLGRSCKYLVASLASNEIAVSITPYSVLPDDRQRMKVLTDELESVIETARIKEQSRLVIRNACVDGAGFMMQSFDPDVETGQDAKGTVVNQVIDSTNVFFGNPYSSNGKKQWNSE